MGYSHERDEACSAVVLADHIAAERDLLGRLRATPGIEFINQSGYARNDKDLETWSPGNAEQLQKLRRSFRALVRLSTGESETLLLRLGDGAPPSVPASRRALSAKLRAPR